jgi:anaerobic nitric oxide reductase transcription regulator
VLAATNRNLVDEVAAGRFRTDLFHRLSVYPLSVPPLRERGEDIALLAGYFCDLARRRMGVGPVRLDASAIQTLSGYSWPGNVRELENIISRVVLRQTAVVARGEAIVLSARHVGAEVGHDLAKPAYAAVAPPSSPRKLSLKESLRGHQRETVTRVLAEKQNNIAAAARALGMDRGNFHRLVKRLGLQPSTPRCRGPR